ncbi:MAG: universal stress protein, partial [Sphingomonadaceae bacterium]|nr:universal stress protein [Sphingomonadaceae bacterium]
MLAEAATTPACLDAAEAAAHVLHDATIEALHVVVDPEHIVCASEELAFEQLRVKYEGTAQEREAATHAAYEAWIAAHPDAGIPLKWKVRIGAEEENVEQEARTFDVLVLAKPTNMDGGDAFDAALHRVKHPFFFVPSKWKLAPGDTFAEHIVVAWNNTPACKRAVEGALPWLRVAAEVTTLLIAEDRELAQPVERLFADEGIRYRVHQVARDEENLGVQIVTEAH